MEGTAHFVAMTVEADDGSVLLFDYDMYVAEVNEAVTEEFLRQAMLEEFEEHFSFNFNIKYALVGQNMPFAKPTECEFTLTFAPQGDFQDTWDINELTLPQIRRTLRISKSFGMFQAFKYLLDEADRKDLVMPISYSYKPL